MTSVCRDIFKAIHEGKWLKIEYRNKFGEVTNYWIAIQKVDVKRRALTVKGIRVENSYARRYNHIKSILMSYFAIKH